MKTITYVTIPMLAKHVNKNPRSVRHALIAAKTPVERIPGVKGLRIVEKDANRFLLRQWPEAGMLPPTRIDQP
jgi:hypothetical protein